MSNTIKRSFDTLIDEASETANTKVTNRELLQTALEKYFECQKAAKNMKRKQDNLKFCMDAIKDAVTKYADNHFEPREVKSGIFETSVEFEDGKEFVMTKSAGPIERISGNNKTQEFLEGLPKEWVRTRLELDTESMNKDAVDAEEMEKFDLCRPDKVAWRMVE